VPSKPLVTSKVAEPTDANLVIRNYRDEMKSLSPIDSYENRGLVFLIHKSIFLYAANSQFGPTSGSFCY
jgi:hypothetical protein